MLTFFQSSLPSVKSKFRVNPSPNTRSQKSRSELRSLSSGVFHTLSPVENAASQDGRTMLEYFASSSLESDFSFDFSTLTRVYGSSELITDVKYWLLALLAFLAAIPLTVTGLESAASRSKESSSSLALLASGSGSKCCFKFLPLVLPFLSFGMTSESVLAEI